MGARHAVLLTPSKSSAPRQLLSCKPLAQVSPLFATLAGTAHLFHSTPLSSSLFSYSYGLFCIQRNANSCAFNHSRTLCEKHPGWGRGGQVGILDHRRNFRLRAPQRTSPSRRYLFSSFLLSTVNFRPLHSIHGAACLSIHCFIRVSSTFRGTAPFSSTAS